MDKFLTVIVLLSLVLAVVASESEETKRANSCGVRAGRQNSKCRSNVSFMKRIYDAYKGGQVDTDTREQGWADREGEREDNEADTVEEKLRLLNELLNELEIYDKDMK